MGRRGQMETPDYAKMMRRLVARYGVRVGEADEVDLAEMLAVRTAFDDAIADAVARQRAGGRSWSEIARGLGTTRQNAQQRFGADSQLAG